MKQKLVVAITGASGVIYGIRLLKAILSMPISVYLVISAAGRQVLTHETGYDGADIKEFLHLQGIVFHKDARLNAYSPDDLFAPPASGSFRHDGMVIAPCSMKTLG
ncbi:MAG TPA: aromatic acid decarboxylase, partial [Desulfobacteraceae bacterium]|nr:aromatic acid decarboxylase [Desulfobacteraceae bacterium]